MRPVLEAAERGEVSIRDVVDEIADRFALSDADRTERLPSGQQTKLANRVHWARSYLKQAALVKNTKRGHFTITERGKAALRDESTEINNKYLEQFDEFRAFQAKTSKPSSPLATGEPESTSLSVTPDEVLREAHKSLNEALAAELLDRIREAPPAFFEQVIVDLLLAMGYGGTSDDAGRALGGSGDGGIDGVIDQDPLGVDQIYLQAKRYGDGNVIGAGAIRDFFGALTLKKAHKGIFVTTSTFSTSATQTARDLGGRIVLIDGPQLARLMIKYNIGCRDEEVLHIKRVDEDFFDYS
jgi:restriction system protein